jgi:protein SCO1/2
MRPVIELRWRTLLVIALNALAVGLLAGLLAFPQARQRLFDGDRPNRDTTSGIALVGGPFRLAASTGGSVTDRDFAGRVMLVTLGYTRDRDFTPATLQTIATALKILGPASENVVPLLITLDPRHDTAERLAAFVVQFHPRLVGLTGSAEAIAAVAKAYRLPLATTVDPATPSPTPIAFEPLIFLMNRKGEYVTHLTHNSSPESLLAAIRTVL